MDCAVVPKPPQKLPHPPPFLAPRGRFLDSQVELHRHSPNFFAPFCGEKVWRIGIGDISFWIELSL